VSEQLNQLKVPELSLVALIGVSGAGKSTFARKHFKPTEVLSSDFCRGLVSDDENSQEATNDAFDVLHYVAGKRLARGLLTVVDATNVREEDRKQLVELAREYHCLPVAIVLDVPERIAHQRNASRPDRQFGEHVIRNQARALKRGLHGLRREGFRHVWVLDTPEAFEHATLVREPLWNNRKHEHGPFDIIGDIHGCADELVELLGTLGYIESAFEPGVLAHPAGRKAIFVGDLCDRGPDSPRVLRIVMSMVAAGRAMCVPGNHDIKLLRKLNGANVQLTHGIAQTLDQLSKQPPEFGKEVAAFLDSLISHFVLDDGRLVVAHAGLKENLQGRGSARVREFCLYGETTGETDEFGLPIRYNWAAEYRGRAMVVYGHTPIPEPEWLNNTINIDTGCVFGGRLTALRYPERELVTVPAKAQYAVPSRPFLEAEKTASALSAQQVNDDVLDLSDVFGKRLIGTRLAHNVTIREENAAAALEVMSRFAADPRWLIYLPPTMSPSPTSDKPGYLEHPTEALAEFRHRGIDRVVCEQKHMGSRAIVIVCKDADAARRRFGVASGETGIVYTRTGRRFFDDAATEAALLQIVRDAAEKSGSWAELATDWLCLDCELMPWSAKAQTLLRDQYAPVGDAAAMALSQAIAALEPAAARVPDLQPLLERHRQRAGLARLYHDAWARYCWEVHSVNDLRLAPFHLLASEKHVHAGRDHLWHMEALARLAAASDGVIIATPHKLVLTTDPASEAEAAKWWEDLVAAGNEGMVIKPLEFIPPATASRERAIQPAVKCRGPEYLRIIYGPEYTLPEHLERLRHRGLTHKRALALREFALGIEGLERFARGEPLRRVHECVFAVLALESEPVDPRL
jgi:protein phosphatase